MTCGLRISATPTSDNLTPQETTKDSAPEVGAGGAGLSCPGVVAGRGWYGSQVNEGALRPLIKSPDEAPSQDTQQEQSPAKCEDS